VKPKLDRRHLPLVAVVAAWVVSRVVYRALGVRFSADPVDYYIQFLDPELLRHDLLRSLFYMRDQPPGFNGFVGVGLKLFPVHYAEAFGAAYAAFGLAFGVALYALMARLGVRAWLAALVTIAFVDSPIAMLYENWLFYTFPLAAMVCAATLFLHRWLDARRLGDAVVFFTLLAVLVWWRNLFHPVWMLVVVAAMIVIDRAHRRQTALAALGPVLAVCALLIKHVIVFHALFQGQPIQQMNLAALTSMRLPEAERARLLREHVLTISDVPITAGPNGFRRYVTTPPKTGIPVLDQEYKPKSGYPNWNSSIFVPVGALYGADARWALLHRPGVYFAAVGENLQRYVLPSDQSDPFNTRSYKNRLALQPLLTQWNRIFSWQAWPTRTPFAHVLGFPLLLGFALVSIIAAWRHGDRGRAVTLAFALYTTLWVSAATLLLSYGDHNRYRFKVSAFYCLFLALAVERGLAWIKGRRDRDARPTPGGTRR
jgi:hypothetical protein